MSDATHPWIYAAIAAAGLSGSAMWSGLETALYCVNRVKLRIRLTDPADRAAARVRRELDHPERTLATVLIGNNTCNYLGTVGLTGLIEGTQLAPWIQILLQVAVLSPTLLIFGEILPKDLMRVGADRWAYRLAPVLLVARWLATLTLALPFVQTAMLVMRRLLPRPELVGPLTGRESFVAIVKETLNEGIISDEQASLVDRALAFERMSAADVMTPWRLVTALQASAPAARLRRLAADSGHTRFPVLSSAGRVIGVVDYLDMHLRPSAEIAALLREPARIAGRTPVREALAIIRQSGVPLAIVLGPSESPAGVVTARDLVSSLTGGPKPP